MVTGIRKPLILGSSLFYSAEAGILAVGTYYSNQVVSTGKGFFQTVKIDWPGRRPQPPRQPDLKVWTATSQTLAMLYEIMPTT